MMASEKLPTAACQHIESGEVVRGEELTGRLQHAADSPRNTGCVPGEDEFEAVARDQGYIVW